MKKILSAVLLILILVSPVYGQRAGQDRVITLDDVFTRSYAHGAGYVPNVAERYNVMDSTTLLEMINAAGGDLSNFYACTETTGYLGLTAGTEIYSLTDDANVSDVSRIAHVMRVDGDGLQIRMIEEGKSTIGTDRDPRGSPTAWNKWGDDIQIVPVNLDTDSVIIYYWARNNYLGDSAAASSDTSNIDADFLELWALSAVIKFMVAKGGNTDPQIREQLAILRESKALEEKMLADRARPRRERLTE